MIINFQKLAEENSYSKAKKELTSILNSKEFFFSMGQLSEL